MSIEIKVPKIPGLKAKVGHCYIQINEVAPRGAVLVELIVQNQVIPVLVPQAGILKKIFFVQGEIVVPGEVLAILETGLPNLVSKDGTVFLENYRADMTRQKEYDTRLLIREGEAKSKFGKGFNSTLALPQPESNARSEMGMGHGEERQPEFKAQPLLKKSQQFAGDVKARPSSIPSEEAKANPQNELTLGARPQPGLAPIPSPKPR